MTAGRVQRETLSISLALAVAVQLIAAPAGYESVGAPLALGLVVGSLNGFVIQVLLDRRAPILPTSILRLALLSLVALAVARLAGWSVWPLVAGIGIAQLVMVGVGVRQGLRA